MSVLLTSTTMRAARHGSRSFGCRCRVTAGASTGRRQNAVDESLPFGVGRVVFLYGSAEGRPVVGHRLREFKQLGSQVHGAAKWPRTRVRVTSRHLAVRISRGPRIARPQLA